jgi:hypothetical protein
MARNGILGALAGAALDLLASALRKDGGGGARRAPTRRRRTSEELPSLSTTDTVEVNPHGVPDLRLSYAPDRDGAPDAGEVVWTWVPYEEGDGRGKDRPVLVIGAHTADRVYAIKLTSRSHDGDREFLPLGSGPWDAKGWPSWADLDQLYSVHVGAMRREAAALDLERFTLVARRLQQRYGWSAGE